MNPQAGLYKLNLSLRIAGSFLLVLVPLTAVDHWLYDRFFRARGPLGVDPEVVIVPVQVGRQGANFDPNITDLHWTQGKRTNNVWRESTFRPLLKRILAGEPKAVVVASYYDRIEPDGLEPIESKRLTFSAILNEEGEVVPPPGYLAERDAYGFCNIFPDNDGIVRRTFLRYSSGQSLASRLTNQLGIQKSNGPASAWIGFRGPAETYPRIVPKQILSGDPKWLRSLKGKIVVLGKEGGPGASLETPFGPMSRLEIQSNILDSAISNQMISIAPPAVGVSLSLILVSLSILLLLYFKVPSSWHLLFGVGLFVLLADFLLFVSFKVFVGITNPMLCIFGTQWLILAHSFRRQENERWKLEQQAHYLREMDEFKNNFLSLFSHDLKTPIAKVKAVVGQLTTQLLDRVGELGMSQPILTGLKSIDRATDELARLISDILKVTKMESMPLKAERQVVDLNRLVERSAQSLKFLAEEKKIRIVLDMEPLFSFDGDPNLIQEVTTNLIENAIKYSPPQSSVVVKTTEKKDRVQVEVRDEGPGIPPEEIPKVTGKFYRGSDTSNAAGGTGLGLYLSKYFVELHGGTLEIASQLGQGTRISFSLPISG